MKLRKVMLLAAMLAMALAAAAPALAQSNATEQGAIGNNNVQYNATAICSNIIGAFGDVAQLQSGNADAVASNNSAAIAEVAQEQGVTQAAVVECVEAGVTEGTVAAAAQYEASASASATAAAEELPETGGASLLALGAGALLVAGGLLARRIVR